jgi:hypothetical protein
VLGSILTRQYRFATRGIEIGLRTAHQAVDIAGGIVGDLIGLLGRRDGDGDGEGDIVAGVVMPDAPPPPSPPEPAPAPEPAHVSTEPVLVEESAEPGAEDGAGAQVRVGEPWPGYRSLKARDVVARLPFATREELAAVELFERAGANRKSVVVAAQRALKKASPPR